MVWIWKNNLDLIWLIGWRLRTFKTHAFHTRTFWLPCEEGSTVEGKHAMLGKAREIRNFSPPEINCRALLPNSHRLNRSVYYLYKILFHCDTMWLSKNCKAVFNYNRLKNNNWTILAKKKAMNNTLKWNFFFNSLSFSWCNGVEESECLYDVCVCVCVCVCVFVSKDLITKGWKMLHEERQGALTLICRCNNSTTFRAEGTPKNLFFILWPNFPWKFSARKYKLYKVNRKVSIILVLRAQVKK